jgi:tryptophan synthase alpha chain
MNSSILTQRISRANGLGRKAVIPFLPAGFPDKKRFWKEIAGLDRAGADIIEIGVPFSDPVADGPVVEQASLRALEAGVTLEWILSELLRNRSRIKAAIVLMGYYNPFLQFGLETFARRAAEAGVNGIIVPDLPLEESGEFRTALEEQGIDLIALVGLNTSLERMIEYSRKARGFVYYVSVLGTTGGRDTLPEELKLGLQQAQEAFSIPVALGFGIRNRQQLERFEELIDAVVIGSALISHIDAGGDGAIVIKNLLA